ncbi:MAG: thioesterase family protein [Chloroflexi bacterium]|nr:thioesterase family protein [Chloroflexota bacterium]
MPETATICRNAQGRLVVETRFRVRYCETDAMGIVHHASYVTWFEEGRSAFTRAIGYPYAEMERDGVALAVAEVHARYHRSARYDEEIIVATCLTEFPSRGMTFVYEVRRSADDALLVSGSTKHISVDATGRVQRIPDAMRTRVNCGLQISDCGI